MEFQTFVKIARLSREVVITEKIDGTNGLIAIGDDGEFQVGSRNRWITVENDNSSFARWAYEHRDELMTMGAGFHYGEWWGAGIQRRYGLEEKRFSLFNTYRWSDELGMRPACCHVVPVILAGTFTTLLVDSALMLLVDNGSYAAPGFMNPEGVVIYHAAAKVYFKKTIEGDESPKSLIQPIIKGE